ncbi:MAG TPA: hypothetical protein VNK43_01615 [Gemmatimonadales bacterium]|nr:hypothetical protein [Gemmatimonadales bacterium]
MTTRSLLILTLAGAAPAAAQVGYPPDKSPFRDIRHKQSVTFIIGDFGGDGGRLGIGPHDGAAYGVRYDYRLSNSIQFAGSVSRAELERLVAHPDAPVAEQRTGPVGQTVTFAEVSLQLNLTGAKTWRRLAPYVGVGGGLAFGSSTPADTTAYEFGNKLYVAPNLGVRVFLTDQLHLRAEARQVFWKLSYPASFADEPSEDPGSEDDPHALIPDGRLDDWSGGRWLWVGLGYSFSF